MGIVKRKDNQQTSVLRGTFSDLTGLGYDQQQPRLATKTDALASMNIDRKKIRTEETPFSTKSEVSNKELILAVVMVAAVVGLVVYLTLLRK